MAGDTLTSAEYIRHHLTNLTFGKLPDGTWDWHALAVNDDSWVRVQHRSR